MSSETGRSSPWFTEEHELLRQQLRRFVEEEVRPHADAWEQEMMVGFSIGGNRPTTLAPSGSSCTLEAWAKTIKTALVKALRVDRHRGGLADDTRDFAISMWTWGDQTGCGYTINFKIMYRTGYNDPDTPG